MLVTRFFAKTLPSRRVRSDARPCEPRFRPQYVPLTAARSERVSNRAGREGKTAGETEARRAVLRETNYARREGQTADEAESANGSPAGLGFVRSVPSLAPVRLERAS